jgi:hypothetical protein
MSANLYLPAKAAYQTSYTIATPGSYTWVAPNALNSGASYTISLSLWGGGGGGYVTNSTSSHGGGGGGGAWLNTLCTVVPGVAYTLVCGGTAGNSYIQDSGGQIITAGGGGNGGVGAVRNAGAGGTISTNQPSKVSGTLSINGGAGGVGRDGSSPASAGTSVSSQYGQPGGIGGAVPGAIIEMGRGGGGASANASGGTALYPTIAPYGGGGGAGYYAGQAGGPCGAGRIQFSFTVSGGGSAGSAPA